MHSFYRCPPTWAPRRIIQRYKQQYGKEHLFLPSPAFGLAWGLVSLQRDWKNAWVLLVFFLFTGIVVGLYLNQAPYQVRERDYVLVGSFYVFAIWIGFGTYSLFHFFGRYMRSIPAASLSALLCLGVLGLLAWQNWDDHDRSNRYSALTMAKMYLDSVAPNAILFTVGDNDTFLLWYVQQIEGYRRDVRVVNTTLLSADWHIDQMKRKAWQSQPIPSQLEHHQYRAGTNDFVIHQPVTVETMDIATWMNWIVSEHPGTYGELDSGQRVKTFPTKRITVPVNKENVISSGIVPPEAVSQIVDSIPIDLETNVKYKNELFLLDLLANNDWQRPIYFAGGSFDDKDYMWMRDYLQLEGMVYKLVPILIPGNSENPLEMGRIDTDSMFPIVKRWDWGNMEDSEIYHAPFSRRNTITYRRRLSRLADALLREGDHSRAKQILDLRMEKMPVDIYGNYFLLEPFMNGYFELEEREKALQLWEQVAGKYQENLRYYSRWSSQRQLEHLDVILTAIQMYQSLVDLLLKQGEETLVNQKIDEYNLLVEKFSILNSR